MLLVQIMPLAFYETFLSENKKGRACEKDRDEHYFCSEKTRTDFVQRPAAMEKISDKSRQEKSF